MFAENNHGGILPKLVIALLVLAGGAYAVFSSLQRQAIVKAAERQDAVDAVTGSVFVDAQGGTAKELKAEADGKVVECSKIVEAQRFKAGELLVKLDTSELERAKRDAERKYKDDKHFAHIELTGGKPELMEGVEKLSDEARAKLYREVSPTRKLAVEKLENVKRLHGFGNLSADELRSAERALESLDIQLQKAAFNERKSEQEYEAQMEAMRLQLERMEVRAPSDGEIVLVNVWQGEIIGRNHVVATFMSHERVVSVKISEEQFGKVQIGQPTRVRLLTYGDRNFDAKVSKMLPKADDAQKFTVFLDVKVDSPDQLRPGSTGEATITVAKSPNAVQIPRVALFDTDKVCVVKGGRVERRQVEVGFLALNRVEIRKGIEVGEEVIVDMPSEFRTGDRVKTTVLK